MPEDEGNPNNFLPSLSSPHAPSSAVGFRNCGSSVGRVLSKHGPEVTLSFFFFILFVRPYSPHFPRCSAPSLPSLHPPSFPPPPPFPELFVGQTRSPCLMFGWRRGAWCSSQARHCGTLAPPYEGLYHRNYYSFMLIPLSCVTCMSSRYLFILMYSTKGSSVMRDVWIEQLKFNFDFLYRSCSII